MGKKEKLFQKALESQNNLTFSKLCSLAEEVGFVFRRQSGSHKIYKHYKHGNLMNFQPDKNGKAIGYQVRQLIDFIQDHKLIGGE